MTTRRDDLIRRVDRPAPSGDRVGHRWRILGRAPVLRELRRAPVVRELLLLSVLYVAYTLSRLFADDDLLRASSTARGIESLEHALMLDIEHPVNDLLVGHLPLEVIASYWYATAHYLVTPIVLVVLWRSGRAHYASARNALALATGIALAMYLLLPTAPPRLLSGFHDVLADTSAWGWWGADASAPRGLGTATNELAAMPSLHVGWAVWCALSVGLLLHRRWQRLLAWLYPLVTAVVVVATGNHWLLDVLVGAGIVIAAHRFVRRVPNTTPRPTSHEVPEGFPGVSRARGTRSPAGSARRGRRAVGGCRAQRANGAHAAGSPAPAASSSSPRPPRGRRSARARPT